MSKIETDFLLGLAIVIVVFNTGVIVGVLL